MNSVKFVNKLLILGLFTICPFVYGLLLYTIKLHFNIYEEESFYFYYGNYNFLLTCVLTGLFLAFMIYLHHWISDVYKYGKVIGLTAASILPLLWIVIILIASIPGLSSPICKFLIKSMQFLFYDNDILSSYLILITIIVLFNLSTNKISK